MIKRTVNLITLFYKPNRRFNQIVEPVREAFKVVGEMQGTDTKTDDLKWMVAGAMMRFCGDEDAKSHVKLFADFFVDEVVPTFNGITTSRQDVIDWVGGYAVSWMESLSSDIHDVITLSEAESLYGKKNLRSNAKGRLVMWKSGGVWLTTRKSLEDLWGL